MTFLKIRWPTDNFSKECNPLYYKLDITSYKLNLGNYEFCINFFTLKRQIDYYIQTIKGQGNFLQRLKYAFNNSLNYELIILIGKFF